VSAVERLRDVQRDVDSKVANQQATVHTLERELGASGEDANIALLLRSDPIFQAVLEQLGKEDAQIATLAGTRGPKDAELVDLQAQRASALAKLAARAADLVGHRVEIPKIRDLSTKDERAHLFERLIGQIADAQAMVATQAEVAAQIAKEQARVVALAPAASHLDDLKRDVQVAEAVFSSALARADTNKQDFYASYPLAQVLEAPQAPTKPSSPLPLLALAGGFAATLFILAALVLAWLRTALFERILKSA
jgi:uncharacterized protein involved in exopolysaccharide biosynthesis